MAQTVNYLTEHNLLEYAVLEEKAAAATAHHNELSAKIKAAEKRMAEIAVLRTHIINYANRKLLTPADFRAGYRFRFDVDALARADTATMAEKFQKAIRGGWMRA